MYLLIAAMVILYHTIRLETLYEAGAHNSPPPPPPKLFVSCLALKWKFC